MSKRDIITLKIIYCETLLVIERDNTKCQKLLIIILMRFEMLLN